MALEEILQGLASTDILDFELGGHGGWYIKYEVNGVTEQSGWFASLAAIRSLLGLKYPDRALKGTSG